MCVFNFKSVSCVYLISNYICVLNKKKKRNKENFVKKKKKKYQRKHKILQKILSPIVSSNSYLLNILKPQFSKMFEKKSRIHHSRRARRNET